MKPQVMRGTKSRRRMTWYGRSRLRSTRRGALNAMTLTRPMTRRRANDAGAELMGANDATSRAPRVGGLARRVPVAFAAVLFAAVDRRRPQRVRRIEQVVDVRLDRVRLIFRGVDGYEANLFVELRERQRAGQELRSAISLHDGFELQLP